MTRRTLNQSMKRVLLKWMVLLPYSAGCSTAASLTNQENLWLRFKGIGLILVVDAVPGAEIQGVVFYNERNAIIYAKSVVAKRNREIMVLGSPRIPLTVRVLWRHNPKPIWGRTGGIDYEGPIAGDYTIPIAERIPDAVVNDIRIHGGGLRLKFRLKPDGVLFGWDIERPGGGLSRFEIPGGDFLETRY